VSEQKAQEIPEIPEVPEIQEVPVIPEVQEARRRLPARAPPWTGRRFRHSACHPRLRTPCTRAQATKTAEWVE